MPVVDLKQKQPRETVWGEKSAEKNIKEITDFKLLYQSNINVTLYAERSEQNGHGEPT